MSKPVSRSRSAAAGHEYPDYQPCSTHPSDIRIQTDPDPLGFKSKLCGTGYSTTDFDSHVSILFTVGHGHAAVGSTFEACAFTEVSLQDFESMFILSGGLRFPYVHESGLDSMEMVNVRHRNPDGGPDASRLFWVGAMKEKDDDGIYHMGRGKARMVNVDEEDAGQPHSSTSRSLDVRPQISSSADFDTQPFYMKPNDAATPKSGIEQGISSGSEFTRPCPNVEPDMAHIAGEANTANIIIFGEAGVGKSSIVNLIAGEKRTPISNDALGCTFQYQRHAVTLNGVPISLWDTAGLDEGTEGSVPARQAENSLRTLMQGLADSGGIHLVIYCIRGSRLTTALKHNYDLFYSNICRKRVPVALVVTGLEHQQGDMETWWEENEVALQRLGMWFDAHACVTTLDVDDNDIRPRRSDSQGQLRQLVARYARSRPLKVAKSSVSWFDILRGASSTTRRTSRRVIVYDATAPCRTRVRLIGERQLECEEVFVNDPHMQSRFGKPTGATVLVFYTSALPPSPSRLSLGDLDALKAFYDSAGRKKYPVIVVFRGCNDDQIAQSCCDAVTSELHDRHTRPVVDAQAKLDAIIEELCIEHVNEKTSPLHKAYEILMEILKAMSRLPEAFALQW